MAYNEDKQIEINSVEAMPEQRADSDCIDKLSGKKIDELGKRLKSRLDDLKAMRDRKQWETDKILDFNYYHLQEPAKPLPYAGYPNTCCPFARIGADTAHANDMFTFAGQSGKFTVLPEFLSRSHLDVADRSAKYMTYVLNYESDMYSALDDADLNAHKYSVGYLEPVYIKECAYESRSVTVEEEVPEINELTGEVTAKKVKKRKNERVKKVLFDGVKVKSLKPETIYVSPFFETIEDAVKYDAVFKVCRYPVRMLEAMSKALDKETKPFFDAARVRKVKDKIADEVRSNFESNKMAYDGFQLELETSKKEVELAEVHTWEDVNDDGIPEKITAIIEAQSGTVLRVSYAPCRIVVLKPRPVDGRWFGESTRRLSMPFAIEWEAIRNQRVAKGQWSNLPFFFYKAGGRLNPQQITLMPGKGYPVDDPGSINFPQMPQVDGSYFQEEQLLWNYLERVLALGDNVQGLASKGDQSATESINVQQRASIRLSNPINRIAVALNDLMGHIWDLNKQCAPAVKEFKVAGVGNGLPVFSKITNADYDVQVSFKLNMATMFDVQMARDTALLNYKTFMVNPLVMNHPAALYELTKDTMKKVGCELPLPKPVQATARSPFLEHDMIREGKKGVDPVEGEDVEEHLAGHESFMQSDEYKEWPEWAKQELTLHYDKTQILKQTLAAANLNASGIFEGMPGAAQGMAPQPGMTATRNPSQQFNNLRVEETPKSQKENVKNGFKGAY
jgi:hypothetical protein